MGGAVCDQRQRARKAAGERDKTFGWSSLHHLANEGNARKLKALLSENGPDVHLKCHCDNAPVHVAARAGAADAVGVLVARRADVNARNDKGWTPLMLGAINGHFSVTALLLEAAADPERADLEGRTACMWAARHGSERIVRQLLPLEDLRRRDHDGLMIQDHAWEHPEMLALVKALERVNRSLVDGVLRSDFSAVTRALHAGAQVDHLDEESWRPIMWAALHDATDLVHLLLRHGASPALDFASTVHLERLGIEHSSMVATLRRAESESERFLAAAAQSDWSEVQELLGSLASVNALERPSLNTALMHAAGHGAARAIDMLVEARASLERRDWMGRTALHWAVEKGHAGAVATLHRHRADVTAKSYVGDSLIHLAVRADDASTLQLLLAAKCKIEEKSMEGLTLAQVASERCRPSALKVLFAYSADMLVTDELGRSPLATAVQLGHAAIVRILVDKPGPPPKIRAEERLTEAKPRKKQLRKDAPSSGASGSGSDKGSSAASSPINSSRSSATSRAPVAGAGARPRGGQAAAEMDTIPEALEAEASPAGPAADGARLGTPQDTGGGAAATPKRAGAGPAAKKTPAAAKAAGSAALKISGLGKLAASAKGAPVPSAKGGLTTASSSVMLASKAASAVRGPATREVVSDLIDLAAKKRASVVEALPDSLSRDIFEAADSRGDVAVTAAVRYSQPDLLPMLLQAKAAVDGADEQGNTPLILAAGRNQAWLVDMLLEAGAQHERQNANKQTAMDVAETAEVKDLLRIVALKKSTGAARTPSFAFKAIPKNAPSATDPFLEACPGLQRLRLDGLPVELRPDLLDGHVRALLRRMGAEEPDNVNVPVDPVTRMPQGQAYVDFHDPEKTEHLLRGGRDALCSSGVKISRWGGPRYRAPSAWD